ncbi:hypothetical protein KUTeg_010324 [Tegillarca granosa]|uniref:DDE-1 domain-containing protein n=1 Tax=Tegillarca granosa TaxID=220873 RepID=A0ABQ9F6D8_TEGGR|nr:hypothetical protein KUTeg_010324 [Tegillarca granosa]
MSSTGWSNTEILGYIPNREPGEHLLLILDGHLSHVAVDLVEWAKSKDIVILILPAHTSHVLQPLEDTCYGPLEKIYNNFCQKFIHTNSSCITSYDICGLACKAYTKALVPDNLIAGFTKTGIYPLDKLACPSSLLVPSSAFTPEAHATNVPEKNDEDSTLDGPIATENNENTELSSESPFDFLINKLNQIKTVKCESKKVRKPRRWVGKVVSGRAITEPENLKNLKSYIQESSSSVCKVNKYTNGKKSSSKKLKSKSKTKSKASSSTHNISSPQPGSSRINISDLSTGMSSCDKMEDSEKCCVCNQFTPKEIRDSNFLEFTQWVQCDTCAHWVHLKYCTSVRVVRLGDKFNCIHCKQPTEE